MPAVFRFMDLSWSDFLTTYALVFLSVKGNNNTAFTSLRKQNE